MMAAPMNREEQVSLVRLRGHLAMNEFRTLTVTHEPEILDMMASRLYSGYDTFGFDGFRQTPYEIVRNALEEGADGGNYMLMHWFRTQHPHLFR